MRIKTWPVPFVVGAVAVALTLAPSAARANTVTANEVTSALAAVDARNNNLVVDATPSTTDADSAAQTAGVDVPVDPSKGVKLHTNGTSLTIHLPGARKGDRGTKRGGMVVYNSAADSVNAVVPARDGVQLWTHIRNKRATEDYRYCTEGVTYTVLATGGAIGFDAANKPVAFIPPPTATEKKTGESVPTSYKADGNCLVQHVAHKGRGTSYPVVADPSLRWYWDGVVVTLSRGDMATVMYGGTQALVPMLLVPGIGWGTIAGVLWVSGHAAWAYANHKCAWFWLPYIGWGASMGWYNC